MAVADFYLDPRRPLKDGTWPLRIRVTHERKTRYFDTIFSFSKKDFEKIISGFRLSEEHRIIADSIDLELKRARGIIKDLKFFSFQTFKVRFTQKGDRKDLCFLLEEAAALYLEKGQIGSANLYKQSAQMLMKYSKGEKIMLDSVNQAWLEGLERWALLNKYSYTTLGMYLIRVRKIFNDAIRLKEFSRDEYPFGRDRYSIPTAQNNKRALDMSATMAIYNYEPVSDNEQFAKDIYIFSYLANGMNAYDIFLLTWRDLDDSEFSFLRKKTINTAKVKTKISVIMNDELQEIITRQGNEDRYGYIFPVIRHGMTPEEEHASVRRSVTKVNTYLKRICKKIGISEKVSLMFARHSYSTTMMEHVPISQIMKDLGHTKITTTQNYLGELSANKRADSRKFLLQKPDKE